MCVFMWLRSEVFAMIVCGRYYKQNLWLKSCLFIIFLNKVIMFLLLWKLSHFSRFWGGSKSFVVHWPYTFWALCCFNVHRTTCNPSNNATCCNLYL